MPKMTKRIQLDYNKPIFIAGRCCKVTQSKSRGVNLWVEADCPIATETVEVVDLTKPDTKPVKVTKLTKARA